MVGTTRRCAIVGYRSEQRLQVQSDRMPDWLPVWPDPGVSENMWQEEREGPWMRLDVSWDEQERDERLKGLKALQSALRNL